MVYTFPDYITGIPIAIALISALIGAFLLWKRKPFIICIILFGIAALAGVVFAPILAMDRVVLDDEKLEQTTGFWFAPTVKGFRLADVKSVTISTAVDPKGREREVWIVRKKSGQTEEIDPGDLWELNGPDIIERLREKGIEVNRD